MYLLDSDYIINFLNGQQKAIDTIRQLNDGGLSTSVICVAEILEGLYTFEKTNKIEQFEKFLSTLTIHGIDTKVAHHFALIRSRLRKKGETLDNFDLLIAATCLSHDKMLVTQNTAHYKRISGLKLYPAKK